MGVELNSETLHCEADPEILKRLQADYIGMDVKPPNEIGGHRTRGYLFI